MISADKGKGVEMLERLFDAEWVMDNNFAISYLAALGLARGLIPLRWLTMTTTRCWGVDTLKSIMTWIMKRIERVSQLLKVSRALGSPSQVYSIVVWPTPKLSEKAAEKSPLITFSRLRIVETRRQINFDSLIYVFIIAIKSQAKKRRREETKGKNPSNIGRLDYVPVVGAPFCCGPSIVPPPPPRWRLMMENLWLCPLGSCNSKVLKFRPFGFIKYSRRHRQLFSAVRLI